jgi:D-glycero-D-manno-heptose 1,7-bisphosphate phosphatase
MTQQLTAAGAHLTAIYYCPHTSDDDCECRKPKPGLLERAAREHRVDLSRSFVIGDRYGDVALAHGVSSRGILVRTGYGEEDLRENRAWWPAPPDFVANDLAAAVDWILRQMK